MTYFKEQLRKRLKWRVVVCSSRYRPLSTTENPLSLQRRYDRPAKAAEGCAGPGIFSPKDWIWQKSTRIPCHYNAPVVITMEDRPTLNIQWGRGPKKSLNRTGTQRRLENYRGITLVATTLKVLTTVISVKILKYIHTAEEQQGFRTNKKKPSLH